MISFHAVLSPERRSKTMIPGSSRKRKWGEVAEQEEEEGEVTSGAGDFSVKKRPGLGKLGYSTLDVELCQEEPLPVEWRRCLDVQLGEEVRFHYARTKKGSCKDKGKEHEGIATCDHQTTASTVRRMVSLNLELNLQPYDEYLSTTQEVEKTTSSTRKYPVVEVDPRRSSKKAEQRVEEGEEDEEMVATVCGRCHMLVMLCVARPCCPNCKFLHPRPEQTPFTLLFKQPPKCTTTAQLLC